jgi:glycolate dehydrogenase FAD-linked subunit
MALRAASVNGRGRLAGPFGREVPADFCRAGAISSPICRYKSSSRTFRAEALAKGTHVPVTMPLPDQAVLDRRGRIAAALRAIVPGEGVIASEQAMRPYESDGLTAYRQLPMIVVLPETTDQVRRILEYCHGEGIKVVPRGAGTSLSGGALPLADGVLLGMAKFNRILEVDLDNRAVVVQPGVTNLAITQAVEHAGFHYAPDPSSQIACTIGGNVAENSGGVHCLKYGVTSNNVLGLEMVLMTGEIIRIGGKHLDSGGYDLLGVVTGSEGLLGVVTEVTVRILRKPESARAVLLGFATAEDAGDCVAKVISAGIIPAGMEMMDRPAIHAVEQFVHAGYPLDVEALLIVELDGPQAEVDYLLARVQAIAQECHAVMARASNSEQERLLFWAGRKAAFPAAGRISPDYYCMDGTIPRAKLPLVLRRMREMSETYGLAVANVFHAGDGNLHPLILYDANRPGELDRAEAFGADILRLCVEVGGVLTGEHGVGVEKRDLMPSMFSEVDLAQQQRLKCAFDDRGLLNPGKVFPTLHRCAELGRMHVRGGKLPFPDLPRF